MFCNNKWYLNALEITFLLNLILLGYFEMAGKEGKEMLLPYFYVHLFCYVPGHCPVPHCVENEARFKHGMAL